ncbi:hypothetical protein NHJ13734_009757 [Beauveria thailandica]
MGTNTANTTSAFASTWKVSKLKASCDFCALTKVKCDQNHPQCLRCVKNGIDCHYSETQRIGKARQMYAASRHVNNNSKGPSPHRDWRQESSCSRQQDGALLAEAASRNITDEPCRHHHHASSDYTMSMNLFNDYFLPAAMGNETQSIGNDNIAKSSTEAGGVLTTPESADTQMQNLDGSKGMATDDTQFIYGMDPSGDHKWLSVMPHSYIVPSSGHAEDCIKRIFRILQTLHMDRSPCTWSSRPSSSPTRTLDTALKNNRTAMDTVREVLECPCAHSIKVSLFLVIITDQVMESYRSIFAHHGGGGGPSSSSSPVPQSASEGYGSGSDGSDPLYDTPLSIGVYLLDDEMRSKVILQLIRSELDKMGALLATFARHTESVGKQPDEAVLRTYVDGLQETRSNIFQSIEQQLA